MAPKKQRRNRRIAKIYSNTSQNGTEYLSVSVSKPFKDKTGKAKGGRLLFEDVETEKLYLVKSASIFEAQDSAVFDVVIDLDNDYNVEELG